MAIAADLATTTIDALPGGHPQVAVRARGWGPKLAFAGTIFCSAFLLFLVQPLMAKQILPWFGGSAAVWSVCMVFFQVTLLAGYAYSDVLTRWSVKRQAQIHVSLLVASVALMPIVTHARWKPMGGENPSLWILGLLVSTIGLPYFLLSTTGPLLQSWLARAPWSGQVYRYFSLSNLASLVSLLAYPVMIEPQATLLQQAHGWSWAYGVFVALCTCVCVYTARHLAHMLPASAGGGGGAAQTQHASAASSHEGVGAAPGVKQYVLWLGLPGMATWLLLAMTNHLTQNVASIPFLWVLPLSVYLLTFVLTFESDRWYRRRWCWPAAALALVMCALGLVNDWGSRLQTAIPTYGVGLFVLCMFLHGEMARLRPSARYLTRFYLMLSLGGALGGITVGLLAPQVLPAYYELGLGLVLTTVLAAFALRGSGWPVAVTTGVLAVVVGGLLVQQVREDVEGVRVMRRNFYGTLATTDSRDAAAPQQDVRQLYHGAVKHGEQYLAPSRRRETTTYYGPTAGIGRALATAPQAPRKVGLIGLGAGTLAAYGRPNDVYRVYEINPQVFEVADEEFTFLRDTPARIERVLGDARLALEREAPQDFDVLAVDAFSGDSVPIHLITTEAVSAYLRHMKPDGVVAFHVTNRYIALAPVLEKIAQAQGLAWALVHDEAEHSDHRRTDWVLIARQAERLALPAIQQAVSPIAPIAGLRVWTDDFNHLFGVLK